MKFRRAQSKGPSLVRPPLIALIDVVLFLLIYFIMAGSISPPERELSTALAAQRRGGGSGSDFSLQILTVDRHNNSVRYRLGNRAFASRQDMESALAKLPKAVGLVVRAADDVAVADAAAALQAARSAGFFQVTYVPGS